MARQRLVEHGSESVESIRRSRMRLPFASSGPCKRRAHGLSRQGQIADFFGWVHDLEIPKSSTFVVRYSPSGRGAEEDVVRLEVAVNDVVGVAAATPRSAGRSRAKASSGHQSLARETIGQGSPKSSSMTDASCPSWSNTSNTVTTLGWLMRPGGQGFASETLAHFLAVGQGLQDHLKTTRLPVRLFTPAQTAAIRPGR